MSTDSEDEGVYRIEISDTATAEADAIYLWIGQSDADRADRWFRELLSVYDGLSTFPHRNVALPHRSDVRRTLHGRYRILYLIVEPSNGERGTVRILRVVHGARQSELNYNLD